MRKNLDLARVAGAMPAMSGATVIDPKIEQVAQAVIGAAIEVHKVLGPGYSESVYERSLSIELNLRNVPHACQHAFRLQYKGADVGEGRLDVLVEPGLIVELNVVESLTATHESQLVSYLRANGRRLGLLINFDVPRLKEGIRRIIL